VKRYKNVGGTYTLLDTTNYEAMYGDSGVVNYGGLLAQDTYYTLGSCDLDGCDTIQVTYTLEGEEPVTIEVSSSGVDNGKNYYGIEIEGFDIIGIGWGDPNGEGFLWYVSEFPDFNVPQAFFLLDTPCPFGVYTIEEGSIFEAFEVNGVMLTVPAWSYEPLNVMNELSRQKTSKRDMLIQEQVTAKRTFDYKSQIL
jgi:hypothetical protein